MVWQRCGLWLSCSCRGGVGQWAQGGGARKAGGTGGDDCPNEAFPFYSEAGDQRSQLESWWTGCRTVKTMCATSLLKVVPVTVCWVPVFTDGNLSLRLAAPRFDFQPGVTHTPIPMAQWRSRVEWQTLLLHFLKIKMGCSGWKWGTHVSSCSTDTCMRIHNDIFHLKQNPRSSGCGVAVVFRAD